MRFDESVDEHGIGLAIVRELVEEVYDGKLSFERLQPGTSAQALFAPSNESA